MAFGNLKKWFEDRATDVFGGKQVQTITPDVQQKVANAKYGVLANNPQAQQQFTQSIKPQPFNVGQAFGQQAKQTGTGLGLGAVRSLTGIGQGVSGMYDLATPGTGTNRFSKKLDTFARFTDDTAKQANVMPSYKVGQFGTDALTFAAGGSLVKAASKAPAAIKIAAPLNRAARPVNNVANKGIAKVAQKGTGGRIAAAGLAAAKSPVVLANTAINTGLDVGAQASKGRDIGPKNIALSAGVNMGFGVGLPMAGRAVKEVPGAFKSGANAAGDVARQQRTKALLAATEGKPVQNLPTKRLTSYEGAPDRGRIDYYKKQIQSGKDVGPLIVMKDKSGRLGIEDGKHRYAAYKELGINQVPVRVAKPEDVTSISQGGFVRMPGANEGNAAKGKTTPNPSGSVRMPEPTSSRQVSSSGNSVADLNKMVADADRKMQSAKTVRELQQAQMEADNLHRKIARAEGRTDKNGNLIDDTPATDVDAYFGRKPNSEFPAAVRLPDNIIDPMQRVFDQNPMNPRMGRRVSAADQAGSPTPLRQILAQQDPRTTTKVVDPSVPSANSLPEYNTKNVSALDKAFRSTRSIIERQGEPGKKLASMLQAARDSQELYLGQLQKAMPTVTELARKGRNALVNKDFENFVDATQGLAAPKNAKIAQAVAEWQATHPSIRQRAVDAGLSVGDLGPNYYPHFIDYDAVFKDKNMYNAALNHLVESGQAPNVDEAIRLLNRARDVSRERSFGNLEASRLVDLPFYDKTPNSLISYLNGSAKRTIQTETFGKADEQALKLIAEAGQKGFDTEAMANAYNVAIGAKKYGETADKISSGIRKYITTTRLGLGALTNVSQNVNTGVVTGHFRTMGSMLKQLDPKTREFVGDTGVISDALLNDLRTQTGYSSFSSKVVGKAINKVTAPGFGMVEKFNRSVAATAGRDYALRLAQKGDEATLRKLGVTGAIKNKTLSEAQQVQAARKIVEKTQFKVDPQDLPGWTDSPGGKLVAQFRTFSYNQGKFVSNEILKPAAKGNLVPLARLMAALPVGYALYETKRTIAGRPEEENKVKVGVDTFSNIGGAGLAFDIYKSLNPLGSKYLPSDRRVTMAVGAFGGPAVGVATQGVGGISEAIQRKNTPTDESRLEGKVVAAKTEEDYTDLTPLSRFGLQQIPVVGTGTANRLLPYKKESQADAGKANNGAVTMSQDKPSEILQAAFNSPEGKAFIKLKEADKRAAAASDPAMRPMYDQYKAMQKAFSGGKDLYPTELTADYAKQNLGVDLDPTKVLQRYDRLTPKAKESVFMREPSAEFEYKAADYLRKLADKQFTRSEEIKQRASLQKEYVMKDFDKDSRDIYALSKHQVWDVISKDGNGKKIAENLLAIGDKLVAKGLIKDHPYRDKYGNPTFAPKASGSGGGRGGGRSRNGGVTLPDLGLASAAPQAPNIKISKINAPNVKGGIRVPGIRKGKRSIRIKAK